MFIENCQRHYAPISQLLLTGVAVEKLFFKKFAKTTLCHASI